MILTNTYSTNTEMLFINVPGKSQTHFNCLGWFFFCQNRQSWNTLTTCSCGSTGRKIPENQPRNKLKKYSKQKIYTFLGNVNNQKCSDNKQGNNVYFASNGLEMCFLHVEELVYVEVQTKKPAGIRLLKGKQTCYTDQHGPDASDLWMVTFDHH